MFVRYSLRTTDVASARTFYQRALGLALPEGASPSTSLEAWPLHELARSRGAPAHWLGHLAVDDLEHALGELMALGAETLGPTVRAPSGAAWAAIRDPLGAVLALRARGDAPPDRPIAWHQLHTTDLDRAWPLYARLAGWRDAGRIEAIDPQGGHQLFTWTDAPAGSIAPRPSAIAARRVDCTMVSSRRARLGPGLGLSCCQTA